MNVNLLIDAIVRQTMVLVAQLATADGGRAQLAHTANQVFLDLVRELKEQGLGNKVIADMFGLSLRTYHNKIARFSESGTERGRSLWEAILTYVQERPRSRSEVLHHFSRDDDETVRSMLKDLVDGGMLFRSGRGDMTTYKAATPDDAAVTDDLAEQRLTNFVWVAILRFGPITPAALMEHVPVEEASIRAAIARLTEAKLVTSDEAGNEFKASKDLVIPVGHSGGWEAAVFDHYQAMVTAICTKIRLGKTQATRGESIGGSTYGFDVWDGHPCHEEVLGFLQATRERAVDLRKRVEAHNVSHSPPDGATQRVIAYVGQTVLAEGADGDDE